MKKDKLLKVLLCPWAQAGIVIVILLVAASRLPAAAMAVGATVNNAFYSAVSKDEPEIETSHAPSVEVSDPSSEESSEGYFGDWGEFSDFYEESGTVSVGKPPESSKSVEDTSSEENSEDGEESGPDASDPDADPSESAESSDESGTSEPEGTSSEETSEPQSEPSSDPQSEPSSEPSSEEPSSVPTGPVAPEID